MGAPQRYHALEPPSGSQLALMRLHRRTPPIPTNEPLEIKISQVPVATFDAATCPGKAPDTTRAANGAIKVATRAPPSAPSRVASSVSAVCPRPAQARTC